MMPAPDFGWVSTSRLCLSNSAWAAAAALALFEAETALATPLATPPAAPSALAIIVINASNGTKPPLYFFLYNIVDMFYL